MLRRPVAGLPVQFNTGHGQHAAIIVLVHGGEQQLVNLKVCNEGGTWHDRTSVPLFDKIGEAPIASTWSYLPSE